MKQMILAEVRYVQDNNETHSFVAGGGELTSGGYVTGGSYNNSWNLSLYPYIKTYDIFDCPDDDVIRSVIYAGTQKPASYSQSWLGSIPVANAADASHFVTGQPEGKTTSPASAILISELTSYFKYVDYNYNQDNGCSNSTFLNGSAGNVNGTQAAGYPMSTIHQGGSNYGFADGHAKWMTVAGTLAQQDNEQSVASMDSFMSANSCGQTYFGIWDAQQ